MIERENIKIMSELLSIISTDNPMTCTIHVKENNLLEKSRWQYFRRVVKLKQKLLCL